MRHLSKFLEYINESNGEISDDILEGLLIPFEDMNIKFNIGNVLFHSKGKYEGRRYRDISFNLSGMEGRDEVIYDDKIWEFLDELISLRNRLESDNVSFTTYKGYGDKDVNLMIKISYLIGEDKIDNTKVNLKRIYDEIGRKMINSNTQFSNNMTRDLNLDNEVLKINVSDEFTKRKWSLFTKGIDISMFNVNIEESGARWGDGLSATITITPK